MHCALRYALCALLVPGQPGILMQKRYAKSVPLTGRTPEALVKGWNEALEEILTALVTDLKVAALKDSL